MTSQTDNISANVQRDYEDFLCLLKQFGFSQTEESSTRLIVDFSMCAQEFQEDRQIREAHKQNLISTPTHPLYTNPGFLQKKIGILTLNKGEERFVFVDDATRFGILHFVNVRDFMREIRSRPALVAPGELFAIPYSCRRSDSRDMYRRTVMKGVAMLPASAL